MSRPVKRPAPIRVPLKLLPRYERRLLKHGQLDCHETVVVGIRKPKTIKCDLALHAKGRHFNVASRLCWAADPVLRARAAVEAIHSAIVETVRGYAYLPPAMTSDLQPTLEDLARHLQTADERLAKLGGTVIFNMIFNSAYRQKRGQARP